MPACSYARSAAIFGPLDEREVPFGDGDIVGCHTNTRNVHLFVTRHQLVGDLLCCDEYGSRAVTHGRTVEQF